MLKAGRRHARYRLLRVIGISLSVLILVSATGTGGLAPATPAEASTVAVRAYGPPPPPPAGSPGFVTVLTSVTICPQGGIIGPGTVDGATVAIIVPPGAFTTCVQITIFRGNLALLRSHVFRGFILNTAVGVIVTINGHVFPGHFLKAPTLVIRSPQLTAATIAALWDGISLRVFANAAAAAGVLRITFTSDPFFAVLTPKPQAPTIPVTG